MTLSELQRAFAAQLRDAADATQGPDGATRAGMHIYIHAYRSQLIACLRNTYEKTHAWIGDSSFDDAANTFVKNDVPSAWSLDAYGARFGEHLDILYPDAPDVAELAWLDWHLRRAFTGPDALPVQTASLAAIDWEHATFGFVPTLRFRTLRTDAVAIWRTIADDIYSQVAVSFDVPGAVRVWRDGMSTRFASMLPMETACLDLAMAGASFGEICRWLTDRFGNDTALDIAGPLLRDWLADGLIAHVHAPGPPR